MTEIIRHHSMLEDLTLGKEQFSELAKQTNLCNLEETTTYWYTEKKIRRIGPSRVNSGHSSHRSPLYQIKNEKYNQNSLTFNLMKLCKKFMKMKSSHGFR